LRLRRAMNPWKFRLLLSTLAVLPSCSSRDAESSSTRAPLLGGTPDTEHPAVVALGHQVGPGQYCTGTLITPDLVLTAHHCTTDPTTLPPTLCTDSGLMPAPVAASAMVVVPGPSTATASTTEAVEAIHSLPDFGSLTLCGNDIAVVELKKPITGVTPVGLRLDAPPELGETVTLVGYGQTSTSDPNSSGDRHSLSGVKVDHLGYEAKPPGAFTVEGEFTVDTGPCAGDSGGPALDANGRSMGVMSRGPKSSCTHMAYGRVDAHASFLRALAQESATRLGIDPPDWALGSGGAAGAAGTGGAAGASMGGHAGGGASGGSGARSENGSSSASGCMMQPRGLGSPTLGVAALILTLLEQRRRRFTSRRTGSPG